MATDASLNKVFEPEYFNRALLALEYLVSLVAGASAELQEQYKDVLCDEERGFPATIYEFIVEETKSYGAVTPSQLIDIKWRVANLAGVDGNSVNLVLVHLQLIYSDEFGERRSRNLVMSLEEFSRFYSSFLELSEAI